MASRVTPAAYQLRDAVILLHASAILLRDSVILLRGFAAFWDITSKTLAFAKAAASVVLVTHGSAAVFEEAGVLVT